MNNNIINIAISGAMGRIGRLLIKEILKRNDIHLSLAIIKDKNKINHSNVSKIIGINNINIPIVDSLKNQEKKFDILIDFSNSINSIKNLKFCVKHQKKIVIGTTGFTTEEIKYIQLSSKKTAIVQSANFSIGINVIHNLLKNITHLIGATTDIEIIEHHHRNKVDAPSGTALEIAETILKTMNLKIYDNIILNRKGHVGIRPHGKIGISSIRAGNIIGKHTVMFTNNDEQISISHQAINRLSFAQGAIKAAIWLNFQKNGLFTMKNVLNA